MENSSSFTIYLIPQHFYNGVLSCVIIIKIIKRNEFFLLRGGRLFSEMLKWWVITNNSNTKPVFCNSVFATPQIWLHFYFLFVRWIPSTVSCREKPFLFLYLLGETILQNTNCERLSCKREENCRPNHRVNVLQENLAYDNELFCFSYHLHNINMSFRQGKWLSSSLSHTPAHIHYKNFSFYLLKCWQVHCSPRRQVPSRKTSNLSHEAALSFLSRSRSVTACSSRLWWNRADLSGRDQEADVLLKLLVLSLVRGTGRSETSV